MELRLEGNEAAERLMRELGETLAGRRLWEAVGAAGGERVREHFYERDGQPNKMGAKKTHFWRAAGDSVGSKALSGGGAEVQVKQEGVRLQWKGGTVTPKNSRLLTVPLRAVARGKRAAEFGDLFLLKRSKGKRYGFLARAAGAKRIEVMYALMRSVTLAGDEAVMPQEEELARVGGEAAMLVLRRMLA